MSIRSVTYQAITYQADISTQDNSTTASAVVVKIKLNCGSATW